MGDNVKFEEFVIGSEPSADDRSKYSIAAICAEIEKAKEIAIKEKVFANTIVINENYIKTHGLPVVVDYGDITARESYYIPPMICGLQVFPTKTLLPDNVAFALLRSPQTEFERRLNEEIEKFTNMIAEHLADVFETPCNYSPLDVQMCDYCEDCDGNRPVECWKRVFEMWRKNEE